MRLLRASQRLTDLDSTADTYSSYLRNQVLPQLGEPGLVECDVALLDAFFSRIERARRVVEQYDGTTAEKLHHSADTRRTIRALVGGILQQAVLHQAIASNPIRELERIESPKGHRTAPPRGLTAERRKLFAFVDQAKIVAGKPARPDPFRDRLGPEDRRAVRGSVDDLDLDGIPAVSETYMRLVPVVGATERLSGQGQGPHRARRYDGHCPTDRTSSRAAHLAPPRSSSW